jgi:hypothetical protein
MICVFAARLPSIAEITPQDPGRPMEPARVNGMWRTARSDVPALTFVHYGKQAVNPLARQTEFVSLVVAGSAIAGRY